MVTTTEVGQLSEECNLWKDALRSSRDQFTQYKSLLQKIAGRQTNKEILLETEHLENQFHIQLINIHDLKQAIKLHKLKIGAERMQRGHVQDETLAKHENLYDEFNRLKVTLRSIGEEFNNFINYIR